MSDTVVYSALVSLAVEAVKGGKMTIAEAEETYKVKIPEDKLSASKDEGFYIRRGKKLVPDYYGWANYFINKHKFFFSPSGFYIYDAGLKHYRPTNKDEINFMLTEDTGSRVDPTHRELFIKTLFGLSYNMKAKFNENKPVINLKNGILNVATQELVPHSSNYFFTYCLPVEYNPAAKCDEWMAFLDRIFPQNSEYKMICAQIFGYILYGGDPWLHKAFVLYGEGRNGKSTFLSVLQSLIGHSNFSSVSLSNLNKPFSTYRLDGKLANITGETPSDKINAEIFKEATSGGLITAARKFEDEYDFECRAKFIFACNDMPKFGENTVGMQERLYFIPFMQYFEKSERRHDMKQVLTAELSGILNWALAGLAILLNERYLPETDATNQLMNEYNIESDSVYAWADEFLDIGENLHVRNKTTSLYNHYRVYAKDRGRHVVSDKSFGKRLKKYLKSCGKYVEDKHFDKNNKVYRGVAIKSTMEVSSSDYYQ